ncbi:Transcriptional regulator, ROK family [metagenome]|uniref:Transcriptional regulator, ROK family n=1 Tax=metagenome TaxID=256318 RepID=A0A2P2CES8_9ZZZZ
MPTGPGDVLDLIRRGRAVTRGDVLDVTGLSRMTVAQRIDRLLAEGLVVEGGTTEATGGRRRRSLRFNVARSRIAVASVDTTHTRTAITALDGSILADEAIEVAVTDGPSAVLGAIATSVERLIGRCGLTSADISGIGVSVPGPVDPHSGRPSQPPIMPGWDGYPIADHLASALHDLPVLTANDADAAAVGEYAAAHLGAGSLCLVKVSTGIGTGIVIDGRSYRGVDGGAGDIGHVRLDPDSEAVCQCGAHGCLAAIASGRAIARDLTALGIPASSGRDVRRLLAEGNVDAARLTQQAGRRIGEVMTTVVSVLNPEFVLVGGALASAPLLSGIRETLYQLSLPRATRHITLELGSLGEDAALVGLTRLVVDEQFSPAAVNARLLG